MTEEEALDNLGHRSLDANFFIRGLSAVTCHDTHGLLYEFRDLFGGRVYSQLKYSGFEWKIIDEPCYHLFEKLIKVRSFQRSKKYLLAYDEVIQYRRNYVHADQT